MALEELSHLPVNISTIEDPVEEPAASQSDAGASDRRPYL